MPTTERITQNNIAQNQIAKEFLKKHPGAVVGKLNFYHDDDKEIKNLKDVMPLLNFSFDFTVPHQDKKLLDLIRNYNQKPWTPNLIKDIDKIFARIHKLNGINFYWI